MELLDTSDASRAPSRGPHHEQQLVRLEQWRKMPERGGKERRGKTVGRLASPFVVSPAVQL